MSDQQSDLAESVAERFRKLGNDQFKAGKYGEAVKLYTKSLDKVKSWEAFSNRAAAYHKLERFKEAFLDCAQVLSIDYKNFKAHFRMAQVLFAMKQNVGAVMECEFCLKLWPEHQDVVKLLKDVKEYEKVNDFWQFQTLFVAPFFIELTAANFEVFQFNSWKQVTEKLRGCHTPIKKVDIAEYFDEDAMECFRVVDPVCFSDYISFDNIDFSKASGSFRELFDGLVAAKNLSLTGLRGVDSATLCCALNNFSCFRNASFVNISDPFQEWDQPLMIEIGAIFAFLHSSNRKPSQLIIDYNSLDVGVEVLWDMLVEKFMRDEEKFPYLLDILCPKKLVKPKERCVLNLRTCEVLDMKTDLPNLYAGGDNDYSSGFTVGIHRANL